MPLEVAAQRTLASCALAGELDALDPEFLEALQRALAAAGFHPSGDPDQAALVVNLIDVASPKAFRRRSRTFVAAVGCLEASPADPLRETYPLLVRSLANIVLCYVEGQGVWFTTMERQLSRPGRRSRPARGRHRRAPRAARPLAPRDRQRVPPRPRDRSLGR